MKAIARIWAGVTLAAVFVLACNDDGIGPGGFEQCTGWSAWETSSYILPYPAGSAYTVIQGNCSLPGNGHRGSSRYAYDFDMPIGSSFVAARAGTVVAVEESHLDGQVGITAPDNYIVVEHADGSAALYAHITNNGSLVAVGAPVTQGQLLGFSGNTGNTGNIPHLHFAVHVCDPVAEGLEVCPSAPSNFRNTEPNPQGLLVGRSYTAQ